MPTPKTPAVVHVKTKRVVTANTVKQPELIIVELVEKSTGELSQKRTVPRTPPTLLKSDSTPAPTQVENEVVSKLFDPDEPVRVVPTTVNANCVGV